MSDGSVDRRGESWSGERAERHLRSLELFGMRFGLDRMRRMMTALGSPERRFRSIHVVGTNGKSSTTRMTAAILQRHGLRTGAYLSPHLVSYTERVQVAERDLSMHAFAAAIARAAWAAERVNRTLAEDDHVTQFELLTAAAFWALAEQGVEVAVIEAGLGGRYDATAVIASSVTVLSNVGLEHTRWLGPTVRDIAAEKLAVVRPGTTLALGADLDADALAVAHAVAAERKATIVTAGPADPGAGTDGGVSRAAARGGAPPTAAPPVGISPRAGAAPRGGAWQRAGAAAPVAASREPPLPRGAFQRRNFALARVAAEAYLAAVGIAPREDAFADAAASTVVPGRLQVLAEAPPTVLDGAHNPAAVAALVQSLPEILPRSSRARPLALVMGVLDDKDAASMLALLLPLCARAWFTAPPSPRALSPAALQSLARQLGFEDVSCQPQPRRALARAQEWARSPEGRGAAVLATGSVYLVGDLLAAAGERGAEERRAAVGRRSGARGGGGA